MSTKMSNKICKAIVAFSFIYFICFIFYFLFVEQTLQNFFHIDLDCFVSLLKFIGLLILIPFAVSLLVLFFRPSPTTADIEHDFYLLLYDRGWIRESETNWKKTYKVSIRRNYFKKTAKIKFKVYDLDAFDRLKILDFRNSCVFFNPKNVLVTMENGFIVLLISWGEVNFYD